MKILSSIFNGAVFILLFGAVVGTDVRFPSESVPWGALDLRAPTGFFTGYKLAKLRDDPQACHAALEMAGIRFSPLPDQGTDGECPRENMATLRQGQYRYNNAVQANCGLVAALTVWERNAVAPAAQTHLSAAVNGIDHVGIYACRNVRGSDTRRSEHATARAIDIAGFRLSDGRTINIRRDWDKTAPEGRFLRDVHERSCPIFRGVLGPDYNALHADHFHLDMGRFDICR